MILINNQQVVFLGQVPPSPACTMWGLKFIDPHVEHQDYLNGYFMKHIDRIRKTQIILPISSDSGPASVVSAPWWS